ncbi:MAG: ribbon-helix-helix domain-containing protein [Candidatus Limnocylindrales bacterium]
MKTAVSVPNEIYEEAERLARRDHRSRSEVYSTALREYLARHTGDEVTETLDRVAEQVGTYQDPFVDAAGQAILEATEW